jgi:hypothetical protein
MLKFRVILLGFGVSKVGYDFFEIFCSSLTIAISACRSEFEAR